MSPHDDAPTGPLGPCGYKAYGEPSTDYVSLGWSADQAARWMRLHPSSYLLHSIVNQRAVNIADADLAAVQVGTDAIQSAAGADSRVLGSFRFDIYRVNTNQSGAVETTDDGTQWSDAWLAMQPGADLVARLGDFSGGVTCASSLDTSWLEALLYDDPGANTFCSATPDAPDRAWVPIPYGAVNTGDSTFNVTSLVVDLRKKGARDFMADRALSTWREVGSPEGISFSCKDGWYSWTTGTNTQDATCQSPEAHLWTGPAMLPSDADHDPGGDCVGGEDGILSEDTPYGPGEYEQAKSETLLAIFGAFDAAVDAGSDAVVFGENCAPSGESPRQSINQAAVKCEDRWIGERRGVVDASIAAMTQNAAPTADAGGPYSGDEDTAISIAGTCPDDGLPDPPGVVTSKWAANDCTGTVTFGDASALSTTITVADPQSCSPQLTCCDDGEAACE